MRYIGDVHGKFTRYKKLIKDVDASVQVGDMGVGFFKGYNYGVKIPTSNPPFDHMSKGNHRFIRGNHDNPAVCKQQRFWIPDGHFEDETFFVGGALSIDRAYRIPDYEWWEDEELSYADLLDIQEKYLDLKPKIMITHDCPEFVSDQVMKTHNMTKFNDPSRTRQAFQSYWEMYQPEIWIFGHWHVSTDIQLKNTRFICLAELEYIDL